MQKESVVVQAVVHRSGHSKNTGKEYSFYQAYIQRPLRTYHNDKSSVQGKGFQMDEVFIPEESYKKLLDNANFPTNCEVSFEADFSSGRLRVQDLVLTK